MIRRRRTMGNRVPRTALRRTRRAHQHRSAIRARARRTQPARGTSRTPRRTRRSAHRRFFVRSTDEHPPRRVVSVCVASTSTRRGARAFLLLALPFPIPLSHTRSHSSCRRARCPRSTTCRRAHKSRSSWGGDMCLSRSTRRRRSRCGSGGGRRRSGILAHTRYAVLDTLLEDFDARSHVRDHLHAL